MSFESLRIGHSGLIAAQKALDVTSRNLANAGNENYSRQRITMAGVESGTGPGDGVRVLGVERIRDVLADLTYRSEAASAEANTQRAAVLGRVESSLGPLTGNLPTLLSGMFDSFNQLSMAPTDTAAREAVLNSARTVSGEFQRLYAELENQSQDIQTNAVDVMDEINTTLKQVASLNKVIAEAEAVGVDTASLLDDRDVAFDKLSQLVGATVRSGPGGETQVTIGNYPAVSGETVTQFSLAGTGATGDPFRLVSPAGTAIPVTGGKLGGSFTLVNTDIPGLQARLNNAAVTVRDQLNTAHTAGFDLDGVAGVDLLTGTAAWDLELNAAVGVRQVAASASGAAGDGNNALAIAKLRQDTSSTSAVGVTQAYVVTVGSLVDGAQRAADISASVVEGAQTSRNEISGVNIDEELIDLIRFQRSYQAAATAISVANEVLDTLVNRLIR